MGSSDGLVRPTSLLKSKSLSQGSVQRQHSGLDVNTNVKNNVILYKYDNPKQSRNFKLFIFAHLIGWSVLAYAIYKPSLMDIFTTDISMKQYFQDHVWRFPIFVFSSFIGPSMFLLFYFLQSRTLKYIILNKGGETLTFITHHMFKRKSTINNLPVRSVSSTKHRTDDGTYISLKVKNRPFYFLVEKTGTFVNPKLFDYVMLIS
ncbi:hypothetical protein X777_02945 [Ooceraea biroi]|uniref:Transmembrane protein 223 n=1 Tax=Ooceraea biroi TaxID=2015173 RepID=A0A026WKX7_OOCBI|nr:hypothetical protein X777_02945 [Ooceraea biroi]